MIYFTWALGYLRIVQLLEPQASAPARFSCPFKVESLPPTSDSNRLRAPCLPCFASIASNRKRRACSASWPRRQRRSLRGALEEEAAAVAANGVTTGSATVATISGGITNTKGGTATPASH